MEEKELVELKLKANDGDLEANIELYRYYKSIKEEDQAEYYYDEALDLGWEGEEQEEEVVVEEVEVNNTNDFDESFFQVLESKYANLKLYELKTLADKYDIYAGYQLSKIYFSKGEVDEAIQQLERIKGDLENAGSEKVLYKVFKILAKSYEKIGDNEKAFDCYQNAVELPYSKEDVDRYSDLIRCYDNGIGCEVNEAKATELMKKMSDRNYLYCVRIAESYKAESKMTDAEAYYEKALSFEGHENEVMYRYAKINYNLLNKKYDNLAEDIEYCLANGQSNQFLAKVFNIAAANFNALANTSSKVRLALRLLSDIPTANLVKIGVIEYLFQDLSKTIDLASDEQTAKLFDSISKIADDGIRNNLYVVAKEGLKNLDDTKKEKLIANALDTMNLDSLVNLGILDMMFAQGDILNTINNGQMKKLFNSEANSQSKSKLYTLAAANFEKNDSDKKVDTALKLFDLLNMEALNSSGICYYIMNNIDGVLKCATDKQTNKIYDIKLAKDGEKETIAFFEKYIDTNKVIASKLADYRAKQEIKLKKQKELQRKLMVVGPIVLLLVIGFMFVSFKQMKEAKIRDVALNNNEWIEENQNLYLEKATDIYDIEMKDIISFNEASSASFTNKTKFKYLTLFYTFADGTSYEDTANITVVTDNGQNDYTVNVSDSQGTIVVELGETKNITINADHPNLMLVQPRVFVDYDEATVYGEKLKNIYEFSYTEDVMGLQNAIAINTVGNVVLGEECVFNAADSQAELLIANNKYNSLHGNVKTGPKGATLVATVDGVEVYNKNYKPNVEREFKFNLGTKRDIKLTVTGELIFANAVLDVNQVSEPVVKDLFDCNHDKHYTSYESITTSLGKTLTNAKGIRDGARFNLEGKYEVLEMTFNIKDDVQRDQVIFVRGDNDEELLKLPVSQLEEDKYVCLNVAGVKELIIIPETIGYSLDSSGSILITNANLYEDGSELIDECVPRMNRVALNTMHQVEAIRISQSVSETSNIGETLYYPVCFSYWYSDSAKLVVYPNQEYKKLYGTINMSQCEEQFGRLNIFSDDVLVSSLEIGSTYEPYYFEVDIQDTKFLRFEIDGSDDLGNNYKIYLSDVYLERK